MFDKLVIFHIIKK